MDRSLAIKLAGIFVASFLIITVAIFFLYPFLDEEGYKSIMNEFQKEDALVDTGKDHIGIDAGYLDEQMELYRDEEIRLKGIIDSLSFRNQELKDQLESMISKIGEHQAADYKEPDTQAGIQNISRGLTVSEEFNEDFTERVKSLLNLDEEELAPIVNQMSQEQLVRLYRGGGNIQREKLLRSLRAERAAELMREIML